jgi:hypothetical protein
MSVAPKSQFDSQSDSPTQGFLLSNRECERLGVRREIGAEFETDQLELLVARFRVIDVRAAGVRVTRVSWSTPPPPPQPSEGPASCDQPSSIRRRR